MSEGPVATPGTGDTLVVVDVQNDFLPGGALGVPEGDQVIAPLNRMIALFRARELPVVFSRDWHPPDHCSFAAQGGPWPPHCIVATEGAKFAAALAVPAHARVISKATRQDRDAYSAFDGTGLAAELSEAGIRRVIVGGLATDYCVKATVLDALEAGFAVMVLADAIRAVNVAANDGADALEAMRAAGAVIGHVAELTG